MLKCQKLSTGEQLSCLSHVTAVQWNVKEKEFHTDYRGAGTLNKFISSLRLGLEVVRKQILYIRFRKMS